MTELLDPIRNMPPGAADAFLLAMVCLGAGALGLAGGIWESYREAAKDDPTDQTTERRSERRRWRG